MEKITNTKGVQNDFKINILGEYYDLYVQSDTLLLADVFESFQAKIQKQNQNC